MGYLCSRPNIRAMGLFVEKDLGMTAPIALQLYSVRDALKDDYAGTLRRVAGMGYKAVELAGEYGGSPPKAAALLRDHGLQIAALHGPLSLGSSVDQSVELAGIFGVNTVVCAWLDPSNFTSRDSIAKVAEWLNQAAAGLGSQGLRLAYHNHHFELLALPDGAIPLRLLAELTDPAVLFEIDTYWVQVGGGDPVQVVRELGSRAPLLHIKDGSTRLEDAMLAVGDGKLDFPSILNGISPEWLIVEMDRCDTDVFAALEKSHRYLVEQGLGHG